MNNVNILELNRVAASLAAESTAASKPNFGCQVIISSFLFFVLFLLVVFFAVVVDQNQILAARCL